jgi:hypothetical protein
MRILERKELIHEYTSVFITTSIFNSRYPDSGETISPAVHCSYLSHRFWDPGTPEIIGAFAGWKNGKVRAGGGTALLRLDVPSLLVSRQPLL